MGDMAIGTSMLQPVAAAHASVVPIITHGDSNLYARCV